jgi:hypothetical protein
VYPALEKIASERKRSRQILALSEITNCADRHCERKREILPTDILSVCDWDGSVRCGRKILRPAVLPKQFFDPAGIIELF